MKEADEFPRISLSWALGCALGSLAVGLLFNEMIYRGHGKAVMFGVFVTAFIVKSLQSVLREGRTIIFLIAVASFHVFLVFISPNDKIYPGATLFPAGIIDIGVFYLIYNAFYKRV
jgi:hypothetical protein